MARGEHRIKYKSIEFSISCISGSLKRQNLRHSQSPRPLQGESPHFYALLAPFGLEIVNIEEVVKRRRIIIDCNWLGLSTTLLHGLRYVNGPISDFKVRISYADSNLDIEFL